MSTESYYDILGVNEQSNSEEIKRAYRKLAKENHPDKGGDEELFKKISLAYDTLSNDAKRQEYDMKRKFSSDDLFSQMFSQQFGQQFNQKRVHDTIIDLPIGAIESFLGKKKQVTYNYKEKCGGCNGSGGEKMVCDGCRGQGFITRQIQNGFMAQIINQTCGVCNGTGKKIVNACNQCFGIGTQIKEKTIDITLPQGVDNGQFLRLQGLGDYRDGIYGNLVVRVHLQQENNFEKVHQHLVYNAFLNLEDLDNGNFNVPHPSGSLNIKLPVDLDTSTPLRIKNKGYQNGDLIINQYFKFKRKTK